MSEKVEVALQWLKEILDAEDVEYQIVGGLDRDCVLTTTHATITRSEIYQR